MTRKGLPKDSRHSAVDRNLRLENGGGRVRQNHRGALRAPEFGRELRRSRSGSSMAAKIGSHRRFDEIDQRQRRSRWSRSPKSASSHRSSAYRDFGKTSGHLPKLNFGMAFLRAGRKRRRAASFQGPRLFADRRENRAGLLKLANQA